MRETGHQVCDELASGRDDQAPTRVPPRVWQALAVVAAVVAAAVLGPDLLSSQPELRDAAKPTAAPATPAATGGATPGPLTWKVRGDLRNDDTFLAQALARVRQHDPSADSILFAGTLPDRTRVALVAAVSAVPASPVDMDVPVVALAVSRGQSISDGWVGQASGMSPGSDVVAWATRGTGGSAYAVVLGPPGRLDAEASAFIDYQPDGSASRAWRRLDARDGAAVVDLGTRVDPVVAVRSLPYLPESSPVLLEVVRADYPEQEFVPDVKAVKGLGGSSYQGPDPLQVVDAVARNVTALLELRNAEFRVLWSGQLDRRRGALIQARRPDGPTFHVFMSSDDDAPEEVGEQIEVRRVSWRDSELLPWLDGLSNTETPLRLINPSGAGTAVIALGGGRTVDIRIGVDGVGEVGDQASVHELAGSPVTVKSPGGRRVMRGQLPDLLTAQDLYVFLL